MAEKVAVIGTGYVGLVTGTCMAEVGHHVICVDRDQAKIEMLKAGEIPIFEPGLQELVESNMRAGRLSFSVSMAQAVNESDFIFIAVGTPSLRNGDVDLSQVKSAVMEAAQHVNGDKIIVIKSTVPVGTCRQLEEWIRGSFDTDCRIDVVSNPEFLREGSAVYDTLHSDRLVIGSAVERAAERVKRLLEPFDAPMIITDRETSELIKYASNSFLATKISFINEMANICEKVGADVKVVAQGMGMDQRIGPQFLKAGIGYGGFCLPKDTKAQLRLAYAVDYDFKIIRAVIEVNQLQRERFVKKIERVLGGSLEGKRLAVMGIAFKPETDDIRDAPSIDIIELLEHRGAVIQAYDPVVGQQTHPSLKHLVVEKDPYRVLQGADAMVIITEWRQLADMDWERVKRELRSPVIIDGRNIFEPGQMAGLGFEYYCIGRPGKMRRVEEPRSSASF
ncbi:UDP-glucose dehydrogenase family protein [Ferviditalea candida]|uniref:UDP-glucose 6-dehydrogenase n=1 Tax=Ferviditalea candida TaxID=3108399 RepID=A0ABU5ZHV5_9BACL|nr:UDP-glucose/GDP-mannose dehydrogenase family protein [Paenibacillaceae bacterium T2]